MSKGEIIDFVVLRIQNDLDIFQRSKTIPHTLLEGTYDIEEKVSIMIVCLQSTKKLLIDYIKSIMKK